MKKTHLILLIFKSMLVFSQVTVGNGTSGSCTRLAITNAITTATSGQTISFNCGSNTTIPISGEISVNKSLTFDGSASPGLFLDGLSTNRIFRFTGGSGNNINITIKNIGFKNGSVLSKNASLSCDGGAVLATFTNLTLNGTKFENNFSPRGGAVCSNYQNSLVVSNSNFNSNSAYNGGAIASNTSNLSITQSNFDSNTTTASSTQSLTGNGGAIYAFGLYNTPNFQIQDTRFINNTSYNHGGALDFGGNSSTHSFVVSNSVFYSNKVFYTNVLNVDAGTGGAFFSGLNGSFTNVIFGNNQADYEAGAVFITRNVNFSTVTFANNLSGLLSNYQNGGGAVVLDGTKNCALTNVTFLNNTANHPTGGAMWIAGSNSSGLTANNVIFYNNCTNEVASGTNNCELLIHTNAADSGMTPISATTPNYEFPANRNPYTNVNYPTTSTTVLQNVNVQPWTYSPTSINHPCSNVNSGSGGMCNLSNHDFTNQNDKLVIYPNPSNGIFYIDIKEKQNAEVQVYDMSGRLLFQKKYTLHSILPIEFNQSGTYLINIQSEKIKTTSKIMIR